MLTAGRCADQCRDFCTHMVGLRAYLRRKDRGVQEQCGRLNELVATSTYLKGAVFLLRNIRKDMTAQELRVALTS